MVRIQIAAVELSLGVQHAPERFAAVASCQKDSQRDFLFSRCYERMIAGGGVVQVPKIGVLGVGRGKLKALMLVGSSPNGMRSTGSKSWVLKS